MKLWKLVLLIFFCHIDCLGATGTRNLIIENSAEMKMENLLIEFMTDLVKFNSKILNTHRLVILGKDENALQATKVLLERGIPCGIATRALGAISYLHNTAKRVVLFFVDGFDGSEINSTFAWLPNDFKCRTLLISTKEDTTDQSIASTILSAVERKLRNVMFARFDGQVFKIYGRILNANCTDEIKLLNKWIPTKGFSKNRTVLGHDLILNKHGCPMFVSTFEMLPTMLLREEEKKFSRIRGGLEGHLINTIAEYLNMVPVVKVPSVKDQMWVMSNGTVLGIIGDVIREEASFGIGQIRPTSERMAIVDFSKPYNYECVVWTVPLKTRYNYSVVTSEFSTTTWVIVILIVLLGCGLAYTIPKLNMGNGTSSNILDVIAMTLNYTIPRPPTNLLGKLLFLLYLHYSRVISTAYSTSLSSILTTSKPEPVIVDYEGIIAADLRTTGTQSSLSTLADMEMDPNSTKIELINRYEVLLSVEEALKRMAERQDIAHISTYSIVNYIETKIAMTGKPIPFYTLPSCMIGFHSVIVTPKGSRITREIDNIIRRLLEAGLNSYWTGLDQINQAWFESFSYNSHTLSGLKPIFVLYLCCLIPAFMAFAAELIAFKLKLNWFTR